MRFSNLADRNDGEAVALLRAAFQQTRMAMIATDPRQDDNPIVLVNPAFEKLTGYNEKDAVGRNCRFLQGKGTEPEKIAAISNALDERRWGYFEIRNYRKDGTPFWNALHVSPVYDDDGELIFFFGSQWDVSERVEAERRLHIVVEELAHRVRNMFGLVLGIVHNTDADEGAEAFREQVSGRLQALVDAHEGVYAKAVGRAADHKGEPPRAELGDVARRVLAPYDVALDGPHVLIEDRAALDLALALHELSTNAVKYGALGVPGGRTALAWRRADDGVHIDWTERGGPRPERPERPGFGSQLLTMIADACEREDAGLDYAQEGFAYRFALPAERPS